MREIVVILLCLAFNAILAATELAFVSMRKSTLRKLESEGDVRAASVLKKRENPERTLSVLQLGITFVGVIAAAVGGAGTGEWLTPILQDAFGFSRGVSGVLSILFFVVPYTFLSVVLSELIPKSLAFRNPKGVLFRFDPWLTRLGKVLAPVVYCLETATKLGVKWLFFWVKAEEPEEELKVGKLLRPYMLNLANMEKKTLVDAMVPWGETAKISKSAPEGVVKQVVLETRHTRLPVVEGERPVGILQGKEFLRFIERKEPWEKAILELIEVQEGESLIGVLKKMQGKRSHMSVVFRGETPIGMVTIEDILEEVVGEIYDEDE